MARFGHSVGLEQRNAEDVLEALQERTKRNAAGALFVSCLSRIIWWSVGPAENQVTPCAAVSAQKRRGANRRGTTAEPPAAQAESTEATSPCTWNSGIAT